MKYLMIFLMTLIIFNIWTCKDTPNLVNKENIKKINNLKALIKIEIDSSNIAFYGIQGKKLAKKQASLWSKNAYLIFARPFQFNIGGKGGIRTLKELQKEHYVIPFTWLYVYADTQKSKVLTILISEDGIIDLGEIITSQESLSTWQPIKEWNIGINDLEKADGANRFELIGIRGKSFWVGVNGRGQTSLHSGINGREAIGEMKEGILLNYRLRKNLF